MNAHEMIATKRNAPANIKKALKRFISLFRKKWIFSRTPAIGYIKIRAAIEAMALEDFGEQ